MKRLLPFLLVPIAAFAADFTPRIERLDPQLDALLAPDAAIEKLAEGFNWSEGPAWFQNSVVFSDVPENVIFQWKPGATAAEVFMKPSGMLKPTEGFREQGSNGLGVDAQGRLLICQHGERRIARVEKDGSQTSLADTFEGKRFNSPNDLAQRKNGEIYFTDPPYGLKGLNKSPLKELDFNGVYRLTPDGNVSAVIKDLTFPNGIGFSPDEKTLYVAVSDGQAPRIMAYDVQADGSVANGRVFFDAKSLVAPDRKGLPDGLKVDAQGNLWATGPGGVLILSPNGKHLGSILTGQATGNCAWGDDGGTLYITADRFLYSVKTKTKGAGWKTKPEIAHQLIAAPASSSPMVQGLSADFPSAPTPKSDFGRGRKKQGRDAGDCFLDQRDCVPLAPVRQRFVDRRQQRLGGERLRQHFGRTQEFGDLEMVARV